MQMATRKKNEQGKERERGVAKMERIKRSKRFRATSMNMHEGADLED